MRDKMDNKIYEIKMGYLKHKEVLISLLIVLEMFSVILLYISGYTTITIIFLIVLIFNIIMNLKVINKLRKEFGMPYV